MVSGCPFLIQVTVVAGEPVEIQVTLEDMNPWVTDVMLGGAEEEHNTSTQLVLKSTVAMTSIQFRKDR